MRRNGIFYIAGIVRTLFFLIASGVWALPFYGNQSHIIWKTAESEHFRVHYPAEYQVQAGFVTVLAEAAYDSLARRYRVLLPGKSDVVVRNALFSNGLASPVHNAMNIWLTDWDFKVRSTHFWVSDVVAHEFAHLLSIQSASKFPPWIHGLQISYQDFYNEKVQENWGVFYPVTLYPLWFAEGTAQYESARLGFDAWDAHRDMLLRVAVLEDRVLPLSKMYEFAPNALEAELGPYNQGFSLVRYIARTYGDQAILHLWSELARAHRVSFSAALQQVLGVDERSLYDRWKADITAHYQAVRDSLGVLVTGNKRSTNAFWHDFPQGAGGALWGVSSMGGVWFDGALFCVPAESLRTSVGDSVQPFDLSRFRDRRFSLVKPWLEKGFSIRHIPGQGYRIAYVTYQKRDRNGRAYFDIAVDDTAATTLWGKRPAVRLATEFADAVYPDLSPDGREIVFVRRERQGNRFILSSVSVPDSAGPRDIKDLMLPDAQVLNFAFYTPRWSPDGRQIAFSFFDGEKRQVGVVDRDGLNFRLIAGGYFDARDPVWTPDGRALVISCNRNGIFNLWRYPLDSLDAAHPLTNVSGGAFAPAFVDSTLFYIGYDRDGFSLYELSERDVVRSPLFQVQTERVAGKRFPEPMELGGVSRSYRPVPAKPVVVPMIVAEEGADEIRRGITSGRPVWKAGLALGLSDPVLKNSVELAVLLEMGNGWHWVNTQGLNAALHSDLMAHFTNRSFPWTWSVGYMRRNTVSRDTVRYEDPRSYGDSIGISSLGIAVSTLEGAAGYSVWKRGDSVVTAVRAQWARFDLFEDGFAWDYLKRRQWDLALIWTPDVDEDERLSGIEGSGRGFSLGGALSRSWLFRPGTFRESFTVSAQGAIMPVYRVYDLQELYGSIWGDWENPWHAGARLAGGIRASGIVAWQGRSAATDTLDFFFHHALDLAGYPVLADAENSALHGDRSLLIQGHYVLPVLTDLERSFWIFSGKELYLDVFAQAGSAWWNGGSWLDRLRVRRSWKRSVGMEWRFSAALFRQVPLEVSLNLARALDKLESAGARYAVPGISWNWVPGSVRPTEIALTVGFQFFNPWQGLGWNGGMR